jgi:hypothetical protein
MKVAVFSDIVLYRLVDIGRRFRGSHCLHPQSTRTTLILSDIAYKIHTGVIFAVVDILK